MFWLGAEVLLVEFQPNFLKQKNGTSATVKISQIIHGHGVLLGNILRTILNCQKDSHVHPMVPW